MEAVTDDLLAHRLEGAWPLLDAARLQYRAVVQALRAWRWKARLRRVADVAREVARRDVEVARQLERALRRAEAEGWPEGEVTRALEELSAHRATLVALLEGEPATALRELLREVLLAPRPVPVAERTAVASLALHLEPELLPTLERFGRALEVVFSRPPRRVPFTRAEYDALLEAWPAGERALGLAWGELERLDTSGGLARALRTRAAQASSGGGDAAIDALLRAEFWRASAQARLASWLEARFAPVIVRGEEEVLAVHYLLAREAHGTPRLEGCRGALLMLAHELGRNEGPPLQGGRATLRAWALAADQLRDDPDWHRLRARLSSSSLQQLLAGPVLTPRGPQRLAELFAASDEP